MTRSPPSLPAGGGTPLSPLIHGRVRLLILSHLMRAEAPVPFTELRSLLALTDGTLSVHLTRLQQGGMVTLEKRFVKKRPQTLVAMTALGRQKFQQYVGQLRRIVPGLE